MADAEIGPTAVGDAATPMANSSLADGERGVDDDATRQATDVESGGVSGGEIEEQDARTRLLMAAGPIFAKLGFQRATIREISQAASVNVASVAYYFGDKIGLYRAVIDQVRQSRERRFPAPQKVQGVPPEQALARMVHTLLSRMIKGDQHGWESQLLMRELDNPSLAFSEMVQEFFRPIHLYLKSTIIELIGGNTTGSELTGGEELHAVEDHVAEQFTLSVVGQCLHYRVSRGVIDLLIPAETQRSHFDIDRLCQHITATTIAAARDPDFHLYKQQVSGWQASDWKAERETNPTESLD